MHLYSNYTWYLEKRDKYKKIPIEEEKPSYGIHQSREDKAHNKVIRDLIWRVLDKMSIRRGLIDVIITLMGEAITILVELSL